jgi:tyrosinase
MTFIFKVATIFTALSALAVAAPLQTRNTTCTTNQRKAWLVTYILPNAIMLRVSRHKLTDTEKKAYIDAELCLMSASPQGGIVDGAKSRWDELVYVHVAQSNFIHDVVGLNTMCAFVYRFIIN